MFLIRWVYGRVYIKGYEWSKMDLAFTDYYSFFKLLNLYKSSVFLSTKLNVINKWYFAEGMAYGKSFIKAYNNNESSKQKHIVERAELFYSLFLTRSDKGLCL